MRTLTACRRNCVSLVLLALGAAFLPACSRTPGGAEDAQTTNPAEVVAEVTLTRVERASISSTLSVSGTVAALPNREVRVGSLVAGPIAQMMVAEGDHVRAGQVLAKIDDRPYLDQIRQAEATVAQARANLENTRLNSARNEDLFKRGIAARKDLEDARTQVSVSEAAVRQAEATLALARLQVSRTEVRSPLDGMIVKRLMSAGEQVEGTAAQPLFEVANLAEVELFGNVPALYLDRIRLGQRLRISTEAFPGREFEGRVVAIAPSVDASTNVGLVRIRIANQDGLLRLGMFLTVQLPLEIHPNALVVPTPAVYRDADGQTRVFRVEGAQAEAVPVQLGLEAQGRTELLSGVKAGETVILSGGYGLGNRAKVKVKP